MNIGKIYIEALKQEEIGKWEKGIPNYKNSDILSEQEVLDFVVKGLWEVVEKSGYKIIDWFNQIGYFPNYIAEDKNNNNKLVYIIIFASVLPRIVKIEEVDINIRKAFVDYAGRDNADCLFAAVSIGAADHDRFNASLCLRGDAFYFHFTGLESVADSIYIN